MNNLKKLRKLNGLNQEKISEILNLDRSTYARYEREEIPLNSLYAQKLADFYGVSVSYLLNDENKEIVISLDQYKSLISARNTINQIEKIYIDQVIINNNGEKND